MDPRAVMRRAFVATLLVALALLPVGPVSAHSGDLANPIFERMAPTAPGVDVQVAYSAEYELLVGNTGPQAITFLADSGEPFLRIGPKGVEANFASPTFYDSNVPEGLSDYPPQAKPGPDVPPVWRTLSVQPNWGWYDHRLHPAGQVVPPEVIKADKVAVLGRWTVPFRLEPAGPATAGQSAQSGQLEGRFEYDPPRGAYTAVQKSSQTPADGLKIQVVSGRTVPAVFVENLTPDPVVILGQDGEPFARIGPKVSEVNGKSPTWAAIQQASGKNPSGTADVAAAPDWQQVSDTPRWSWLEFRAAAPKADPPAAVVDRGKTVTVKEWSIPYLIGNRRQTLDGVTRWVPIAELRRQAANPTAGLPGAPGGGGHSRTGLLIALAATVAVLGAAAWLVTSIVRNRNRSAAKGEPWTS
jgi:hypothetical protein